MTPDLIILEDELTRLTLAPAIGGSLVNWTVRRNGQALLRPSDAQAIASASPRRLAGYPLAPWSNRIAQGGFAGPDGWLALAPNSPNDPLPIHGSAWQQPWQVLEQSPTQITLHLDCQVPFAYRAVQRVLLNRGRLEMHLQVTHQDVRAAWHGLGWHPYFPRTAHTRLQAPARHLWQADDGHLSTGLGLLPKIWDFSEPKHLPAQQVDHAFGGWNGECRIIQADAGYQLICRGTGTEHYLLYCPPAQSFFCFEPVTHPVNAHHLPGHPGLQLLRQGQSAELGFTLQYQPLGTDAAG
ncbi:MAG: aldose 1-epimerase [Pseudomonadota bacterium]